MTPAERAGYAAMLFAVDPDGLGGVCLRSPAQPLRETWLRLLRDSCPAQMPWRRIPSNIGTDRLLGDLDVAATLGTSRLVARPGVLAETHGGVVLITMAERLGAHTAALVNRVLDLRHVQVFAGGVASEHAARFGVVALDESEPGEAGAPISLLDRLALVVDLREIDPRIDLRGVHDRARIQAARDLLQHVQVSDEVLEALCGACAALGVGSARTPWLALQAAKAAAALEGRGTVSDEDAARAAALVIAPRAAQLAPRDSDEAPLQPPRSGDQETAAIDRQERAVRADGAAGAEAGTDLNLGAREEPDAPAHSDAEAASEPEVERGADRRGADRRGADRRGADQPGAERREALPSQVLAAARAAIPRDLLIRLERGSATRTPSAAAGRAGALRFGATRGRPAGARAARGRGRLHLLETLRAAVPWQRLRGGGAGEPVRITAQDLREQRFKVRSPTLTLFAVDASGSSALNRLAEAKGAVQLMLADCYIRRDSVAMIAFRNASAELVLPPTRSLVRAKRCLAGLPGGGGTPLAAALVSAAMLVAQARRRGETPTLVLLTDGRANVARNGSGGRAAAHADALAAARALPPCEALLIDSSPRPNPQAREIADAMHARYVALPHPGARSLSRAVSRGAGTHLASR